MIAIPERFAASCAGAPAGRVRHGRDPDYWPGGKDNFAADRELAQQMLQIYPLSALMARENRQFLGRAVNYVARQGIRQFIDVGAGLPTALKHP